MEMTRGSKGRELTIGVLLLPHQLSSCCIRTEPAPNPGISNTPNQRVRYSRVQIERESAKERARLRERMREGEKDRKAKLEKRSYGSAAEQQSENLRERCRKKRERKDMIITLCQQK